MTNEEASEIIDKGLDIGKQMPFLTVDQMDEAKQMAIKALSQQTEYHGTEDMDGLYYCPICQQTTTVFKDGDKCPKCGATMDELSTRAQQTIEAAIATLPPVTPQPEVIRCKDCKHWTNNIGNSELRDNYCNEEAHGFYYRCSGDDYCSFAERRTDG